MVLDAAKIDRPALQQASRAAIKDFVSGCRQYLTGRVLDFGCGLQPYRQFVGGEYVGFDPGYPEHSAEPVGKFDAILSTQVFQVFDDPVATVARLREMLNDGGFWVVTYNASWYEIQPEDKWRFSRTGMEALLGGTVVKHEPTVTMKFNGWSMNFAYGIVAKK